MVSPLSRFAPALPEGEPRAWWVSMDSGKAKAAVGVDRRSVKFRFIGLLEVCTQLLPRPVGRGTSRREGERGRGGSGWRDAVRERNRWGGSVGSLWVESVQ